MSYTVTLFCGCVVYVSCHPRTGVAHTRVVETRGAQCPNRKHDVGARVWLWELLPDVRQRAEIRVETAQRPSRRPR